MSDPILCIPCGNLFDCRTDCFPELFVSLAAAALKKVFSFDQHISIGFKSGEYGGKNNNSTSAFSNNACTARVL
jgi:hypothetical protein